MLAASGPLPASYYDPTTGNLATGLPPRIPFGFTASTGSATDIHEITSLSAGGVAYGVGAPLNLVRQNLTTGAVSSVVALSSGPNFFRMAMAKGQ